MAKAKIFRVGRSQAVRLPKEFRFEGDEVRIRRHGSAVILEPMAEDWRIGQGKLAEAPPLPGSNAVPVASG